MKHNPTATTAVPTMIPLRSDMKSQSGGMFFQYRSFILLAFLALVIWLNFGFIKPLVMGAILATVLSPLMGKFGPKLGRKLSPTLRAAMITLAFTLLILIPVGLLFFAGVKAVIDKVQTIDTDALSTQNLTFSTVVNDLGLQKTMERIYDWLPITQAQAQTYITKAVSAAGAFGAQAVQDFAVSIPGILVTNFILILTIFFLLIDGPRAVAFFRQNSIFNRAQTDKLIAATSSLCESVIVATVISGAVQAMIVAIFCVITKTDGILLFTFITFICSFLPVVGTTPLIAYLAIHAFATGHSGAGIWWIVAAPLVGTSDNVVRPYVLKGGAELHPLIGFVAAFGALDTIGFYGLFIGPIVAGLFFTLLPMVVKTYPRSKA